MLDVLDIAHALRRLEGSGNRRPPSARLFVVHVTSDRFPLWTPQGHGPPAVSWPGSKRTPSCLYACPGWQVGPRATRTSSHMLTTAFYERGNDSAPW